MSLNRLGKLLGLLLIISLLMSTAVFAYEPIDPNSDAESTLPTTFQESKTSHRLIVELESAPLAVWARTAGGVRLANGKIDFNSSRAQNYMAQIEAEQVAFSNAMRAALPRARVANYIDESGKAVAHSYQVVFNGLAIDPGTGDSRAAMRELLTLPGVKAVYPDNAHDPTLYASVPLINAQAAWDNAAIGGEANAGAGIKIASMDGGVHHEAAMFDGTGFSYPDDYPVGGLGLISNNNGKIIASRVYFREWDPPAPGDENPWPGDNGTSHGVHTSSTMAGNKVVADYLGITETISGVAPAAWLMSYRVFYYSVTGDGSFYDAEGIAALEDIATDGADVLNNSWGGGPSSVGGEFDALDTALINATQAGIFVSMSAGNAGPGNGTMDHPSDDYISVAASTSGGTYASGRMRVSAPEPPPAELQDIAYTNASFGGSLPIGAIISHPFVSSTSVDPGNIEGCTPWSGTPFTGTAALISRGSCDFSQKVYYAQQAGAEFVVIYNHATGGDTLINMGCVDFFCGPGEITIPSIFIGHTNGTAMVTWQAANPATAELEMNTFAFQAFNEPDVIASFSSRGPSAAFTLKPDIAAPGVNILAQGYKAGAVGEERHLGYGQASGTSMAAPHVAGAAALLRQIHPDWSNAEIKSALMSTSKYMDVYNYDGSPAQPLDMGAGRMDLTHAADPGVMLDPPNFSFGLVPTGTTESLHVMVTSVAEQVETYTLSTLYTGAGFLPTQTMALPGFVVSPAAITLDPGASTMITVTFDPALGMGIGDNQGYIILDGDTYDAHLPAWARVLPAPSAEVLIIDNDASETLGFPNYVDYYVQALTDLGLTFDVWDADALYNHPTTIPEVADLLSYQAIIYFTGDNYFPDGTFTVATPLTLLDMDRLTEYANSGGILIAMGQDMSSVLQEDTFFDDFVLGDEQMQDSVTGYWLPDLPVEPVLGAPAALDGVHIDLSGPETESVMLSGAFEVPPVANLTTGEAEVALNGITGELSFWITVTAGEPVTLTAAHIHSGSVGSNGPVLYNIWPFTTSQRVTDTLSFSGFEMLTADEQLALFSDELYFNLHSTDNPGGELRGQIVAAINGDGAANQYFVDEMERFPFDEPDMAAYEYDYQALLRYPGPYSIADGVVAMAHRDQPSLERPGISYLGRSIYTSFGLEGVNNGTGNTSREALLGAFLDWAMDEPAVTIVDTTAAHDSTSPMTFLEAELTSNITGTTGVSYRWDFGDGSSIAGPYTTHVAGHQYDSCGDYTVQVEATDSWGNRVIGSLDITVTNCGARPTIFMPLIYR